MLFQDKYFFHFYFHTLLHNFDGQEKMVYLQQRLSTILQVEVAFKIEMCELKI